MYASDIKHSSPNLEEKLARLYTLHGGKPLELSFRQVYTDLLQKLGNPHKKLPPVIHVAGTNGKGSIVATLRSILQAQGYKVHAYTSPHLCMFNERIRLAGELIENDFLESLIDEALVLNGDAPITFFEITTAIAFAAFARTPADILLLEVGLGGRMDCTNIIEAPCMSVISSIGYDHMEFLGDNLQKIATEKGGIIKNNVPCVISAQSAAAHKEKVMETLGSIAQKNGAPLARHGAEWFVHSADDVFKFVYKDVEMTLPHPNLQGMHQFSNVGAALAALQIIAPQFPVSREVIEKGLKNIDWPGRLQNVTPRIENIKEGWEVWLDGGHNSDAAYALEKQAAQWNQKDSKKLHLILGMMNRKDPVEFIRILQKHLSNVTCVDIPGEPQAFKAADMHLLLSAKLPEMNISTSENVLAGINAITLQGDTGRILITGSLYLAGHLLNHGLKSPANRR